MERPKYEQIWSIQEAINMAVAEHRVVRFLSEKTNEQLKKDIVDIKGCKLRKPRKESNDIAVIPPDIDADKFDFDEVNMSSSLWLPKHFYEG
jgi:aspartate carbamoyltransferase regulatory subunit